MAERRQGGPPQNIEAEKGLLGAIFTKNDVLFEVSDVVTAEDFFEPYHGDLFKLMRDQIESQRIVTPTTILGDVSQDAEISGGLPASRYLNDLADNAPPISIAKELAIGIRDNAMRRRIIEVAGVITEACYSAPVSVGFDELRAKLDTEIMSLYSGVRDLGIKHIAVVGDALLTRLKRSTVLAGVELGLKGLQDLTGPLMPGRVTVLAGAPGSGKSALAQQCARYAARARKDEAGNDLTGQVLFVQIEMDEEEMAERGLASVTGIPGALIEAGVLEDRDFERLFNANEAERPRGFYIDAQASPSTWQIEARALRMKRLHGLSLLVIDQLMYLDKPEKRMSEIEAIGPNMRAIKRMAKRLDIHVLVLVPLKSSVHDGPVRRPEMRDLFNPGAMDANADTIIFVHRPEYMLKRREPDKDSKERQAWTIDVARWEDRAEVILGKRRAGEGFGARQLFFEKEKTLFHDNDYRSASHRGELF